MKKIIYTTILFLVSSNAFAVANFNGKWSGPGEVNSNIGIHSACSSIDIEIEQTATELNVIKYQSTCSLFGSTFGPLHFKIQGNKIFGNGEEMGSISDDTLLTTIPDGAASYAFNLKLAGSSGSPALQTYYGAQNAIGAMATEGILHKSGN